MKKKHNYRIIKVKSNNTNTNTQIMQVILSYLRTTYIYKYTEYTRIFNLKNLKGSILWVKNVYSCSIYYRLKDYEFHLLNIPILKYFSFQH